LVAVALAIAVKSFPWWAVLIVILFSFRMGCWGGRLDARGKPRYSLPDGGQFKTYWQGEVPGGFEFLLKRIDGRRPQDGHDYFIIREEVLDGQTKLGLRTVPATFRVSVVTLKDKTVYLFYSI
jgi:hypothetical protein